MWTCKNCGEQNDDSLPFCRNCSSPAQSPGAARPPEGPPGWRLDYRVFRGTWSTWDELFRGAAEFANRLGPERVLTISHSEDRGDGVVTVWYWTEVRSLQ